MSKKTPLILSLIALAAIGCTTVAPVEYHRPADATATVYRIGGEYDPNIGLAGEVSIMIDEQTVVTEELPAFWNGVEFSGVYQGRSVFVQLTKVRTFGSRYLRADVTIDGERAASLTF